MSMKQKFSKGQFGESPGTSAHALVVCVHAWTRTKKTEWGMDSTVESQAQLSVSVYIVFVFHVKGWWSVLRSVVSIPTRRGTKAARSKTKGTYIHRLIVLWKRIKQRECGSCLCVRDFSSVACQDG